MTQTQRTPRHWQPMHALFGDLFDDFFAPADGARARQSTMAMNVAETAGAFRLSFELPGVSEDDISVQLDENQLVVSAERKFDAEKQDDVDFHRVEHRYGSFARSVTLPREVVTDGIEATFKNGVLTVDVPKAEPTAAKRIQIRAE